MPRALEMRRSPWSSNETGRERDDDDGGEEREVHKESFPANEQ